MRPIGHAVGQTEPTTLLRADSTGSTEGFPQPFTDPLDLRCLGETTRLAHSHLQRGTECVEPGHVLFSSGLHDEMDVAGSPAACDHRHTYTCSGAITSVTAALTFCTRGPSSLDSCAVNSATCTTCRAGFTTTVPRPSGPTQCSTTQDSVRSTFPPRQRSLANHEVARQTPVIHTGILNHRRSPPIPGSPMTPVQHLTTGTWGPVESDDQKTPCRRLVGPGRAHTRPRTGPKMALLGCRHPLGVRSARAARRLCDCWPQSLTTPPRLRRE